MQQHNENPYESPIGSEQLKPSAERKENEKYAHSSLLFAEAMLATVLLGPVCLYLLSLEVPLGETLPVLVAAIVTVLAFCSGILATFKAAIYGTSKVRLASLAPAAVFAAIILRTFDRLLWLLFAP